MIGASDCKSTVPARVPTAHFHTRVILVVHATVGGRTGVPTIGEALAPKGSAFASCSRTIAQVTSKRSLNEYGDYTENQHYP